MERRLTAILAADVVGYSRLMGVDEAGTLAALKRDRKEFFEPRARQYNGRTIKLMGDGALMEFASVVDAVAFAVAVQVAVSGRNAVIPEDRRIVYRIGINIGDIIVDGDDIYGDGVNIAARLEELAEPGGICVARSAHDQVRDKLDLDFEYLGEREVKNIVEPVYVYSVAINEKAAALVAAAPADTPPRPTRTGLIAAGIAALAILGGLAWWQPWATVTEQAATATADTPASMAPVLAVLPFDNMSGEKEVDYFSQGITEDIITELSENPGIRVISRNASFSYKGKTVSIRQVGQELGARYVLEGSVRKQGNKVRITAQLIDATTEEHVWAERFDEEGTDLFALQDRVTSKIGATLSGNQGRIKKAEYQRAWGTDADRLEEYDYYLRGHSIFFRFTPKDMLRAREIWREGLRKFPDSGLLRIKIGWTHFQFVNLGWSTEPEKDLKQAYDLAQAGLADENLPPVGQWNGHWLLAHTLVWYKRDYDRALEEALTTLEIVSNDSVTLSDIASIPIYAVKPDIAIEWISRAIDREPRVPGWFYEQLGRAYHQKGDCRRALEELAKQSRSGLKKNTSVIACYIELGRPDDAKSEMAKLLKSTPGLTVSSVRKRLPYMDGKFFDRYLANLAKAGLPE